jgi:hypothetical protein
VLECQLSADVSPESDCATIKPRHSLRSRTR